ncbi:MAG: glycosyltransferase family 1 protein [Lachnospiraceae bacterium]|nr:glycosyltransferase family 1 protein [Lachnospiraceae bacterium]
MRFVVFHKGITETLAYFSACIAKELEYLGYEVFRFEVRDDTTQLPELVRFLEQGEVTLITFNFHGIQKEAIFYQMGNDKRQNVFGENLRLLWDIYKVRCINIVVDHPLYYYKQFDTLPENYVQMCIDGDHENYMKKVYPHIRLLPAMPLAGSSPWEAGTLERTEGEKMQSDALWIPKRMKERCYDIAFTGNYKPPQEFDPLITRNGPEYEQFYREILEELFTYPDRDINTVFERHIRENIGELSPGELACAFHYLMFLDIYVRFHFRGEAVRRLTESGIRVHVSGAGWERLKTKRPDCLVCHGSQDTAACLAALAEAKISLNVMPWFKQGAHDRIYSSMLCGAVSLTDTSRYLEKKFTDREQLVFYRLEELENLPKLAKELLEQEETMQEIADRGYQYAKENLTWRKFVEELSGS